jgi:hypothetical protein
MVDNGRRAGMMRVGDLGIRGGEDHITNGFYREAVVPGVQPDERLTL